MGQHRATAETPAEIRDMVCALVAFNRGVNRGGNRAISMADGTTHHVRSHAAAMADTAVIPIVRGAAVATAGAGLVWVVAFRAWEMAHWFW